MATETLSRARCLELLATRRLGRVAVHGLGPVPLIRPVNYVFDPRTQSVVFRAAGGTKLGALRRADEAAFEVDDYDPESRTGWSVIISGICEPVRSPAEIERCSALGLDSWHAASDDELIRVRAWTISGLEIS